MLIWTEPGYHFSTSKQENMLILKVTLAQYIQDQLLTLEVTKYFFSPGNIKQIELKE